MKQTNVNTKNLSTEQRQDKIVKEVKKLLKPFSSGNYELTMNNVPYISIYLNKINITSTELTQLLKGKSYNFIVVANHEEKGLYVLLETLEVQEWTGIKSLTGITTLMVMQSRFIRTLWKPCLLPSVS